MLLTTESPNMDDYLRSSDIIDFDRDEEIKKLAEKLKGNSGSGQELVKSAYEFVRDRIKHPICADTDVVTCKASEVLRERQGLCYAKSHLLAAILRYCGIPAGLCYQKLKYVNEAGAYFALHGLNAVFMKDRRRWVRLDAIGTKEDMDIKFTPDIDMLMYHTKPDEGEADFPVIFAQPDVNVVAALKRYSRLSDLYGNFPCELAAY